MSDNIIDDWLNEYGNRKLSRLVAEDLFKTVMRKVLFDYEEFIGNGSGNTWNIDKFLKEYKLN